MRSFFEKLIPFIFLGCMIVLLIVGFIIFSYLLIFGALVGLGLFILARIRDKFFKKKKPSQEKIGRVIDHDSK